MSEFFKSAVAALPTAATNPLAFVAYVALIGSWLAIAWKVQRNKNLLKNLEKLPEKDRLKALQAEMGGVRVRGGLSPAQWIRSRIHGYVILGFVIVCFAIVAIVAIAAFTGPPRKPTVATGEVSLRATPAPVAEPPVATNADKSAPEAPAEASSKAAPKPAGAGETHKGPSRTRPAPGPGAALGATPKLGILAKIDDRPRRADLDVAYSSQRKDGVLQIGYRSAYLDELRSGDQVMGIEGSPPYFSWGFPEISIKVTNNTEKVIAIVEVEVKVKASVLNAMAVPVFRSGTSRSLSIVNEGWGDVVDPVVSLGVVPAASCTGERVDGETPSRVTRKTFSVGDLVPIVDLVPSGLRDAEEVCVFGSLEHGAGARRTARFATRVRMRVGIAAGMPSTGSYRLALRAGEAGYTAVLPVDQQVAPGGTDHFVIALAGDKSGHFDLELALRATGGDVALDSRIALDLFVPRSDGLRLARTAEPVSVRATQ